MTIAIYIYLKLQLNNLNISIGYTQRETVGIVGSLETVISKDLVQYQLAIYNKMIPHPLALYN